LFGVAFLFPASVAAYSPEGFAFVFLSGFFGAKQGDDKTNDRNDESRQKYGPHGKDGSYDGDCRGVFLHSGISADTRRQFHPL
jgi:hypothetical protein